VGTIFWVRRFLIFLVAAFAVIAASHLLRGRPVKYAVLEGLLWAFIAASVFIATRIYRSRRGEACAMCRDTPEFHEHSGPRP
jgi:dolichyl-phosphate-mannose--protein O-mannosyl transferase